MNICRICLCDESEAFNGTLVDIFHPDDRNRKFSVPIAFETIFGIKLSESDPHPNLVCLECRSRLEEAFNLRRLALRSHETLIGGNLNYVVPDPAPLELPPEDSVDEQWLEVEPLPNEQEEDDGVSDDFLYLEENKEFVVEDGGEEATSRDQLLVCCGCDYECGDEDELMKHSRKVHLPPGAKVEVPEGKTLCRMCYAVFLSEQVLDVHWSGRTGGRVIRICPHCEDRFRSKGEYEGHECTTEVNDLYRCCGCNFQTREDKKFRNHVRGHRVSEGRNRTEEIVKSHPILCSVCGGRFQTEEELAIHREGHVLKAKEVADSDELTLSCCGCLKVYKTVEELNEHQKQVHEPEREAESGDAFECQKCFKRFLNRSTLKKHTTSRRCYFCTKCPAMRHSVQDMLQHMVSHDASKSYFCCGCRLHRERFDTAEELEQHSREFHAKRPKFYHNVDNLEEQRPFECQTCFRRYKDERSLRKHMIATYQEESYVCDTCGKPFAQLKAFNVHRTIHIETLDYACEICSKKFKHKDGAHCCKLRHIREARKEYICKICGGKFAGSSHLNSHMISHSTVQRYSCSICDMRFKRKTGLTQHMEIHKSERNSACPYCPSRFNSWCTLEKHLVQHTGVFPYPCDFPACDKKFYARLKYIQHYEAHMDAESLVFSCHVCDQRYSRDHFLSHHLKQAHQIEPQDKGWNKKFNRQRQPVVMKKGLAATNVNDVVVVKDEEVVGKVADEELKDAVEYIEQYDDDL